MLFLYPQVRSSANQAEHQFSNFLGSLRSLREDQESLGEPVSIATGSRRSKTQKLSRFGYFGIPCLQLFRGKEALQPRAQFGFVRYDCFDDVVPANVRMRLLVFMQLLGRRS